MLWEILQYEAFPEVLFSKAEGTALRIPHPGGITNFVGDRSTGQGLGVRLIDLAIKARKMSSEKISNLTLYFKHLFSHSLKENIHLLLTL